MGYIIMSYDVVIGSTWINHTYNGSEVCRAIIGMTPQDFDGMFSAVVYKLAEEVRDTLLNNKEKYTSAFLKYNNWGTIDSWINFMNNIMLACKEYPNVIVTVS